MVVCFVCACRWSGFYQLTHAFWIQAHITQLSEVGWRLGASGSHNGGGHSKTPSGPVYVTFVSPEKNDFTIVVVNSGSGAAKMEFDISGAGTLPATLQVWRTTVARAFYMDGE